MPRSASVTWLALLLVLVSAAGWCQDNPYVYVKMPLTVPWALYFVFLGAVLIPFVVMILLAWRKQPTDEPGPGPRSRQVSSEADG